MTLETISVLIRAKNEEAHLLQVFGALARQTGVIPEVILVDSGSTDRTVEIAQKFGAKIIQIKPEEFTYGYALNIGLRAARTPFVAILSADAIPQSPAWLKSLREAFVDPVIAGVYGAQVATEDSLPFSKRDYAKTFPKFRKYQATDCFFSNANAMIRRELWQQVPFDEKLTGAEDWQWAKTMQAKGFLIAYEPAAAVAHPPAESLSEWHHRAYREIKALGKVKPDQKHIADSLSMVIKKWVKTVVEDYVFYVKSRQFNLCWINSLTYRFSWVWGEYKAAQENRELR